MSFYNSQSTKQKNDYKQYLQIVGNLSNLFSDSRIPYLYYRVAEKMFCKAFQADDLSRGDVSYDAKKNGLGIGLKTFLRKNDKTIQKIAEFNQDLPLYHNLDITQKINKVSELRNKRLEFTNNTFNINNAIYHCVVRDEGRFFIYEEDTKPIDISSIGNIKQNRSSIYFDDGEYEYSFSLSKSTLMKRFQTKSFVDDFKVEILKDPLEELFALMNSTKQEETSKYIDTVYLPLYGKDGKVQKASGLNQWNAKERSQGKPRNANEIYIPIPSKFRKLKSDFFPNKDGIFTLILPGGQNIKAKICQQNGKALMSNPNKDLGKWLLRDILKLPEGILVTNEILEIYGVDSVRIDKITNDEFEINFAKLGSYEKFISELE